MKKIAVFGSAFNPPHRGHADVIQQALSNFDEVILVPSLSHAFGKEMAPYKIRQEMVRAFVHELFPGSQDRIAISYVETDLAAQNPHDPIYTYDVLKELESTIQNTCDGEVTLTFVLGPDNADPETWKRFHKAEEIEKRWGLFIAKENVQVRSSAIRKDIEESVGTEGFNALADLTCKGVAKIIAKKQLYLKATAPVDPEKFKDPLPCQCKSTRLICESDPCHYDTWDVVCQHCGAKTTQYATRAQAVADWNAPYIIEAILAWKKSIDVLSLVEQKDFKGCLGEKPGSLGYLYAAVEAIGMRPCEQTHFLQNTTA